MHDLVLHGERVTGWPFIRVRPDLLATLRTCQLHGDTETVGCSPNASLHDELRTHRMTHRAGVDVAMPLVLARGSAADHSDAAKLPECCRELVAYSVREVGLGGIATDVDEGNDREGSRAAGSRRWTFATS